MPLIQVAGISTSGKSTIARELVARGFKAYDTEQDDRSAWFNLETGKRVAGFGEAEARTPEWLAQHRWFMDIDWVKGMSAKAQDKLIFLCGGSGNKEAVRELCDRVIWLVVDEATIRQRVTIPREHDFGTRPHELEAAIQKNTQDEEDYRQYGAILIDARKPINDVVDDVIRIGTALSK